MTADDIALAHREGYASVELLKRYTTLGMATDQGKTANVTGLAILAALAGALDPRDRHHRSIARRWSRSRSAHWPGRIAARHLKPTRLTPSHAWARERGASFIESGLWLRAQWYPRAGETGLARELQPRGAGRAHARSASAMSRRSARSTCRAPTPARFLDRVYTNTFSTLPVGRARYGLMLREDGFVMDDGTTSRLGSGRTI